MIKKLLATLALAAMLLLPVKASASFTVVGYNSNNNTSCNSSSGATIDITNGGAYTMVNNQLVIIGVSWAGTTNSNTFTPQSGYTDCGPGIKYPDSSTKQPAETYCFVWQTGDATSLTFTPSGSSADNCTIESFIITGENTSQPVDTSAGAATAASSGTETAPSTTANSSSDYAVWVYAGAATTSFSTASKGTIEGSDSADEYGMALVGDQLSASGAIGSVTIKQGSGNQNAAEFSLALCPSTGCVASSGQAGWVVSPVIWDFKSYKDYTFRGL